MFDLGPAASRMSGLVRRVSDDQLDLPTPCSDWTVAQLLHHIHQFSAVFTQNAHKQSPQPPEQLVDDWRTAIPSQLDQLATAWQDENAWQGKVSAGGIEMAAADNAVVAIEELTVHGWDLARATGQQPSADDTDLDQVETFLTKFAADPNEGPFGPTAAVADDASRLDRIIAGTGRDPEWSA